MRKRLFLIKRFRLRGVKRVVNVSRFSLAAKIKLKIARLLASIEPPQQQQDSSATASGKDDQQQQDGSGSKRSKKSPRSSSRSKSPRSRKMSRDEDAFADEIQVSCRLLKCATSSLWTRPLLHFEPSFNSSVVVLVSFHLLGLKSDCDIPERCFVTHGPSGQTCQPKKFRLPFDRAMFYSSPRDTFHFAFYQQISIRACVLQFFSLMTALRV